MRTKVVRLLSSLNAIPVENPVWPGTPDVNYREGWIELKWLARWPARGGEVLLPHFTRQQQYFLRERWEAGGNAYLMLQVRREWFVFDGLTAANEVGRRSRDDLILLARGYWQNGAPPKTELMSCLSR